MQGRAWKNMKKVRGFFVFQIEKPQGTIEISEELFSDLVAHAASECFGVAVWL